MTREDGPLKDYDTKYTSPEPGDPSGYRPSPLQQNWFLDRVPNGEDVGPFF